MPSVTTIGLKRQRTTEWLAEKGLAYLAPLFAGFADTALRNGKDCDFLQISCEFATQCGLNEQVFQDFDDNGGSDALTQALECVLARIQQ